MFCTLAGSQKQVPRSPADTSTYASDILHNYCSFQHNVAFGNSRLTTHRASQLRKGSVYYVCMCFWQPARVYDPVLHTCMVLQFHPTCLFWQVFVLTSFLKQKGEKWDKSNQVSVLLAVTLLTALSLMGLHQKLKCFARGRRTWACT